MLERVHVDNDILDELKHEDVESDQEIKGLPRVIDEGRFLFLLEEQYCLHERTSLREFPA